MNTNSTKDMLFINLKNGKKRFRFSKNLLILIILCITFLTLSAFSYAKTISTDLSSSVFRLHVIANSDSKEDQDLKYKVRDNLISYMNNVSSNFSTKDEVINYSSLHLNELKEVAENTIIENGYNYDVNVEIGNFDFPTKTYGDISLPSGYYDALRVKIGNASGQNWWCVMFPPLCFVDVTSGVVPDESKENLQENLTDEDYSVISDENTVTHFKFKIVEFFKNFSFKIANK